MAKFYRHKSGGTLVEEVEDNGARVVVRTPGSTTHYEVRRSDLDEVSLLEVMAHEANRRQFGGR